eukprot:scaffold97732_cov21-Tisochrysis_lutea.AAC.1
MHRSSCSPGAFSGSGQSSPGGLRSPRGGMGGAQPGLGESISNLQLVWEKACSNPPLHQVVHNPRFSLGSGKAEAAWERACLPEGEQQKLVRACERLCMSTRSLLCLCVWGRCRSMHTFQRRDRQKLPTLLDDDLEREGVDAAVKVVRARAAAIAETAFWDHVTDRLKAGLEHSTAQHAVPPASMLLGAQMAKAGELH